MARAWEELFPLKSSRRELALRLCGAGQAFLDAGCGTGSLVRALASEGRRSFGFDLDEGFVAEAGRRIQMESSTARIAQGDLRGVARVFPGQRFDLVACLGQTLPHLLTDEDLQAFFVGAGEVLNPGGSLLVQVVNDQGMPLVRELPPLSGGGVVLGRRRILVSDRLARFETEIDSEGGVERLAVSHRRLDPVELLELIGSDGWRQADLWSDEAGAPFSGKSTGWLLRLVR